MIEEKYISLDAATQQLINADNAWNYHVVPKKAVNGTIQFYADELLWNSNFKNELEMLIGKTVEVELISQKVINSTLGRYYRKTKNTTTEELQEIEANGFLTKLIYEANGFGSSDIHIERYEDKCRVRYRIDGRLIEKYIIPKEEYPGLINQIKIKSNLDIAEKRLPQDGRILFNSGNENFDIRVSVLPTLHGEKVVMRLLSKDATQVDIEELGFNKKQLNDYLEAAKKPHGIILISGPTGSGKTTTLYATLKILNGENTNILTVEDPIEYTLEGINQVQVKEDIGMGFSEALRSFLRQDPDIIMLGEIRDSQTAQMAIRAALTGHLVLSTIHTNSAWGTISRLIDMGVPSYLIANTINLTAAQRLVRLLCNSCKQKAEFDSKLLPNNFKSPRLIEYHYKAVGCEECYYTGYKGRKAVYEIIPIDYEFSEMIKNEEYQVSDKLREKKITKLMESAFDLFEEGQTTIDEVYSILMSNY